MSLGVVEQSAPYCQHASLEINQFRVTCGGKQKILKVIDMGIVQSESSVCLYKESEFNPLAKSCHSQMLPKEKKKIVDFCLGKKVCHYKDVLKVLDPKGSCIK